MGGGKRRRELDELDVPKPADLDEGLEWLAAAALAAHSELQDQLLQNLEKSGRLNFTRLKAAVAR